MNDWLREVLSNFPIEQLKQPVDIKNCSQTFMPSNFNVSTFDCNENELKKL